MIDITDIKIKAGDGGNGAVTFRRARFVPKGGPDGGDGGKGGDIYFIASHNMSTLSDFRTRRKYFAEPGNPGAKKNMFGKDGVDLFIKVPVGTLVYEKGQEGFVLVSDMTTADTKFLVAKGGKGGKGNARFKSSTNQAPTQYTPGQLGEKKDIRLEIKLIADVGLVGAPNVGKSTLINRVTGAKAKVANYPFTTLEPNLGVCNYMDSFSFIIADIPGLIEGASEGKGLGDDFLRHVERTRLLVHLIDPLSLGTEDLVTNSITSYETIRKELKEYGASLEDKPEIVLVNKVDVTEIYENLEAIKKAFETKFGFSPSGVSAVTGQGVKELVDLIAAKLKAIPQGKPFESEKPVKIFTIGDLPNRRIVFGHTSVLEKE
ncbi:hypothetical protein A3K34_00480 [candidate division WWE3 bacterium RIFOXYC1_FULL_40_10]|uniref:GTPase Obg n=1 Tax=candidate division WWE3 bacterium RIFOXYA2_FULL_46_9 TaxID=1802636 RepID=A0A1F4VZ49_UNCKA|nr:MAG: hypothetical protein A3K58_00480 [candidate division WWE3 bacterium RIFOXYB1_FULL_40_22]OGC61361.1 MAG: hypothetical protein A3K37_00480 [candidate division WWE3 bacterium RIFOXYA1_FULL_40_11]OGC62355.1 MAG: hypothetical protein A2264_05305 [candidate division WWE3 bacterium RIFOXYA2_FULL_46_9]OGC65351.1 MAG: hypothetical protein A2326_04765 [candidate division WWE3 bacterium RIFOXYB2_FULL_41_6]OGC65744.1 MAG: hypothetical protein A3K34_00480 [candidate division WWE3 bacterium RIFOXYC1_